MYNIPREDENKLGKLYLRRMISNILTRVYEKTKKHIYDRLLNNIVKTKIINVGKPQIQRKKTRLV